ncbi:MAG: hypothetical protein ABIN94_05635 [Ferruginibacter sp.]
MINNQNQRKVFLVIIAILLIANISVLVFFLQKKEPAVKEEARPDRNAYIMNFLQKDVGFTTQQLVQYDTLSKQHREKISGLYDALRKSKTQQFIQLATGNFSDSVINVLADQSAASQKIIASNMFTFIRNIRMLCTPEQLPKYDSLFVKVFSHRGDGKKKTEK